MNNQLNILNEEILCLLKERPNSTKLSIEDIEEELEKIEKVISQYSKWESYIRIEKDIEEVRNYEKELASVNRHLEKQTIEIPYNSDCWACRLNPTNIWRESQLHQRRILETKILMTIPDLSFLKNYDCYLEWKKQYDNALRKKDNLLEQLTIAKENSLWLDTYKQKIDKQTYFQNMLYVNKSRAINEEYLTKKAILYSFIQAKSCRIKQVVDDINKKRLYISKPFYDEYILVREQMDKVSQELDLISIQYAKLEEKKLQYTTLLQQSQTVLSHLNAFQQNHNVLELLSKYFQGDKGIQGLKEWIQKEKVIPFLLSRINPIIQFYGLRMEVACDNQRYDFFLKDTRTNIKIIYDRASGFQKFITGLAMRIALSKIGASNITNKQMIIDEGFLSCDKDNLTQMPNMVRHFLVYFDNIILISHLDIIRQAVDYSVNIEKNKNISRLIK